MYSVFDGTFSILQPSLSNVVIHCADPCRDLRHGAHFMDTFLTIRDGIEVDTCPKMIL